MLKNLPSSLQLIGSNNLVIDQNVAGRIFGRQTPDAYIQSVSALIDQILPNQRTWIISPFAFLEYLGLSRNNLPIPNCKLQKTNSLEAQIREALNQAIPHFESVIDSKLDLISRRLYSEQQHCSNRLASEIVESRIYFFENTDHFIKRLGHYLAYDFVQNLDIYSNPKQDHISFFCSFMKSHMEGMDFPLFRLIMSEKFIRTYQNQIKISALSPILKEVFPFSSNEFKGLKLKGDRLDCEIIHQLVTGILDNGEMEPVTVISEEEPKGFEERIKYAIGMYETAIKRVKLEFTHLDYKPKKGRYLLICPLTGNIKKESLVEAVIKLDSEQMSAMRDFLSDKSSL